jgi:uncharacterized membrane protein
MKTHARHLWDALSASYWFVPMLMLAGAYGLATGTLMLDRSELGDGVLPWVYGGGPDGARTLLSTVASSVITVAGVVFSITIAALTQASSQFGPRLLRNFMRDRGNQLVLGTFVATFMYCLLVLRTVRGQDDHEFVPNVAVTVGVGMAVASLCVLIYFIHHVSFSLQAPHVIARVAAELREVLDRVCPRAGRDTPSRGSAPEYAPPPGWGEAPAALVAPRAGYIQAIDLDTLVTIAHERDVVLRILRRPGHFVTRGEPLARVSPIGIIDRACTAALLDAFIFGTSRTPEQDVEFAIDQLVEIAVRSLSAGINDPTTAMTCVDWLAVSLVLIAEAELPPSHRFHAKGELRVIADVPTFRGIVEAAFDQIRQYGRSSVPVTIRLLEAVGRVATANPKPEQRIVLREQADMIVRQSASFPEERDRKVVAERHQEACRALAEGVSR